MKQDYFEAAGARAIRRMIARTVLQPIGRATRWGALFLAGLRDGWNGDRRQASRIAAADTRNWRTP